MCQFRWNCSHPSSPCCKPSWPADRDGWLQADFKVLEAASALFNVFCREQDLKCCRSCGTQLGSWKLLSAVLLSLLGLLCRNKLSSSKMFPCEKALEFCIICLISLLWVSGGYKHHYDSVFYGTSTP